MKRCSKCGGDGPFNKDSSRPDGLSSWCKECIRTKNRNHYRSNSEDAKLNATIRRVVKRDAVLESSRRYNKKNAEEIALKMAERRRSDPANAKTIAKRYRQKNKDKVLDRCHVRRARIKNNGPVESISRKRVWERDGGRCWMCCRKVEFEDMHLDHVVPVSRGGVHTYGNVKTACEPCNLAKHAKMPQEVAHASRELES